MRPTEAWLRVKKEIDEHSRERAEVERVPAMRAEHAEHLLENPKGEGMAQSRKQRAASLRNLRKARASRGGRRRRASKRRTGRVRRRRSSRRRRTRANPILRKNPVAKTAAGRRRQRAASRRNIKKAQRASRRTRRVTSRVRAIRRAAGRGGVRLVRVRQASTPIVIEERPRRRKRRAALLENPRRRKKSRRTRRRSRRYASASTMLQQNAGMSFRRRRLQNPLEEVMQDNQAFSVSAIQAAGLAGLGVGLGLVIADGADRFVATRKPKDGNSPWYGANAAAAQNRRPDAWRLGAQAAGGVAGVALAYAVRGRMLLPFLVGGTAVGFFANLTKMLLNWYAMPMVFKVASGSDATFANRMYPLEQKTIQDAVDSIFENWMQAVGSALNNNQLPTPTVAAIIPVPTGPAYTLGRRPNGVPQGKARARSAEVNGRVGQPVIVPTGRLGMCDSCGGEGGCWSHCPDLVLCGDCVDDLVARRCNYVVQPGDDLATMAARHGIDVAQVDALNAPGYWAPGNTVVLPFAMCRALDGPVSSLPVRQALAPSVVPSSVIPSGLIYGKPNGDAAEMPFGLSALPEE